MYSTVVERKALDLLNGFFDEARRGEVARARILVPVQKGVTPALEYGETEKNLQHVFLKQARIGSCSSTKATPYSPEVTKQTTHEGVLYAKK